MPAAHYRLGARLLAATAAVAAGSFAWAASGPVTIPASQKGQSFRPSALTVHRGDIVQIVNDDGELLHHAYVDSKTFSFDSGDQAPGEAVEITFTKQGTFTVLCGIHPKMKLRVQVD